MYPAVPSDSIRSNGKKDAGLKTHIAPGRGSDDSDESRTLDRETFGKRLRSARKAFGWTLAHLAELSGVSITTISRAERGQLALGYENFAALGKALRMDMGSMFAGAGAKPAPFQGPVVTRAGEGVTYRGVSFSYEFLGTEAVGKQMIPVVSTVHARRIAGPEDFARHPGEEFVYVLSGEIEVHFDGGERVRLARGDSLYFDARMGHAYISLSRQLARIVGVMTSESSFMKSAQAGETEAAPKPAARRPRGKG
ncbi:Transcriptional regulator, MerR family [Cupriavidus basilensis]|uniref:Transcriptional regulator, MerR family n=1 Tax=Cupriavidus basilensis TaxID=68895 RepID=A0A0C4Y9P5_9BURK|nr:Transcriptional regulator, MerR family [Cupriavidus basilensis]